MYGYGADDTMTAAQQTASYAYQLLQSGYQPEAVATLNQAGDQAVKTQACQLMTQQAAADADKTMAGKVSAACATAGAGGASSSNTALWLVLGGVGLVGLLWYMKK